MSEHPLIVTLRNRRIELGLSKLEVQRATTMSKGSFDSREDGRFGALEQFERWCNALGYKLTLTKIEAEPIYYS